MPNAHVNKVVYGSETLIDLTSDTITAENVIEGYTFHGADGSTVEGALTHLTNAEIDEITGGGGGSTEVTVSPLSVTSNGTYTAPSGTAYSPVTVSVPAVDSTLVVTLSYNESTEMWEPDCTYAEAYAAYQDGKDIVFVTTEYDEVNSPVFGEYVTIFNSFRYIVISPIIGDGDTVGHTETTHFWDAQRAYVGGRNDEWYARDATAQPSQVVEGAVFYNANGKQVGTATPSTPTLQSKSVTPSTSQQTVTADSGYDGLSSVTVGAIPSQYIVPSGTKSITENGTVDVSAYASASVNVPTGGATNFVHGEFTTQGSDGAQSVTIPYTGSGYPIMAYVVVKGGAYVSGTDWYNAIQRYAVGMWAMSKSVMSSSPTYGTSGTENQAVTCTIYKSSANSAASYSRNSAMNTYTYSSSDASKAVSTCVRFNDSSSMSVCTATSGYGLFPETDYEYFIVYSE